MTTQANVDMRQRLLVLYLANSCLHSEVVAWAEYDGTGRTSFTGEECERPYLNGLAAMLDGWRVIKFPEVHAATTDNAYQTSVLPNEFVLEKMELINHG
jgi:hypothetical protein